MLAAYSYVAPILTDQAGPAPGLVPAVLAGYGICSFLGTLLGGRLGDKHAHAVMIAVQALSALVLLAMATLTGITWLTALLVILLGAFGLSANAVLIHLAVTYAGRAQTLGSALVVAAFYSRTPMGTPLAGASLGSALGLSGPATVGTIIVILTLIPTIALAVLSGRVPAAAQRPVP